MSQPFVLNGAVMAATKASGHAAEKTAVAKAGDRHLADPLWSVMEKTQVAASGNKHDYLSLIGYYWPNPDTPDGLPYVYRDGKTNPEYTSIPDKDNLNRLVNATGDLAAAWYFTGDRKYSDKAALLIRTWFNTAATRMNPNMQYAGVIRGVNTGTFTGIIEGCYLYKIIDAVRIISASPSWTATDDQGFIYWCNKFYTWLTQSAFGKKEATNAQNHGTYYHLGVAAFAEFTGHTAARATIAVGKHYIDTQIRNDGFQPLEMARTRPWNYSNVNITGLCALARFGELEGIDLWHYVGGQGGSIRKAIDFLRPYAIKAKPWTFPDLDPFRPWLMTVPLRQAATAYSDASYTTDANKTPSTTTWPEYTALLY